MRTRPADFYAPMVRAILDGTKPQARCAVEPQPTHFNPAGVPRLALPASPSAVITCLHGQPGDRLWVRETWRHTASDLDEARRITEDIMSGTAVDYSATYVDRCMRELAFTRAEAEESHDSETWHPAASMPRWASRITLEITGVRVERLQAISEAEALAEGITRVRCDTWDSKHFPDWKREFDAACAAGCKPPIGPSPATAFRALWAEINGVDSWDTNPWVWVVEFKRVQA